LPELGSVSPVLAVVVTVRLPVTLELTSRTRVTAALVAETPSPAVDVQVTRLRRKIDASNEALMIRNVRGAGFVLSVPPL